MQAGYTETPYKGPGSPDGSYQPKFALDQQLIFFNNTGGTSKGTISSVLTLKRLTKVYRLSVAL